MSKMSEGIFIHCDDEQKETNEQSRREKEDVILRTRKE